MLPAAKDLVLGTGWIETGTGDKEIGTGADIETVTTGTGTGATGTRGAAGQAGTVALPAEADPRMRCPWRRQTSSGLSSDWRHLNESLYACRMLYLTVTLIILRVCLTKGTFVSC